MTDKLSLLWKFNNLEDLESEIAKALGRWDKRPELKDYLPQAIIFNLDVSTKIPDEEYLLTLEVQFDNRVQTSHFMIEGVKYK